MLTNTSDLEGAHKYLRGEVIFGCHFKAKTRRRLAYTRKRVSEPKYAWMSSAFQQDQDTRWLIEKAVNLQ